MFYYKEGIEKSNHSQAEQLRIANDTIQKSIEEKLVGISEKLKKSGVPDEEHDEIIKNIKRKAQIKMIGIFKEELKKKSTP